MSRGKLGSVKKNNAKKAYRALKRILPMRLAKAGANRVGQVTTLKKKKSYSRKPKRKMSFGRMKRKPRYSRKRRY